MEAEGAAAASAASAASAAKGGLRKVVVALDWSPNTIHTGLYAARALGFYEQAGLEVHFLSPHADGYKTTPAARLASGEAAFACVPSESVVSHHTWPGGGKPKIVAVAALLQGSASAIVALKGGGVERPRDLDGRRYASYAARYEARIVQSMIRADGGEGSFQELVPPMLTIWSTLLDGTADATWVFMPWEGVAARRAGAELNAFRLEDYGIKYGYSPVLAATPGALASAGGAQLARDFLAAAARGYEWAAAEPERAAALLVQQVAADCEAAGAPLPSPLDPAMVEESQREVAAHYLEPSSGAWGRMDPHRWEAFLDWLSEAGLLTTKVQSRDAGGAEATTLDGLRGGDVGERIPRESVDAAAMATNAFLPGGAAASAQ